MSAKSAQDNVGLILHLRYLCGNRRTVGALTAAKAIRRDELTDRTLARFHAKYERGPAGACWPWLGALSSSGYGSFGLVTMPVVVTCPAHRIAFAIEYGDIPAGVLVLHRCDFPPCVNPGHLFPGTDKANVADAIKKGRMVRRADGPWRRADGVRRDDAKRHFDRQEA